MYIIHSESELKFKSIYMQARDEKYFKYKLIVSLFRLQFYMRCAIVKSQIDVI
jgi:hypothetical protein